MHHPLIVLVLLATFVYTDESSYLPIVREHTISKRKTDEVLCLICACWVGWVKDVEELSVDCSQRGLESLPTLWNKRHVIALNLSGNSLQKLPDIRGRSYSTLRILDLSDNHIQNLTQNYFHQNLSEIYLHNNNITRIDSKVVKNFATASNIKMITLHDNPWICDSKIIPLGDFIRLNAERYPEFSKVTCANKNLTLIELVTNIYQGTMNSFRYVLCVIIFVVIFFLIYKFSCEYGCYEDTDEVSINMAEFADLSPDSVENNPVPTHQNTNHT